MTTDTTRTILVHLNVEAAGSDPRTGDEIADFVLAALNVGLEGATFTLEGVDDLKIVCPLAEEI